MKGKRKKYENQKAETSKKSKPKGRTVLGLCGFCDKNVLKSSHSGFFGKQPDYKHFEGIYFHDSRTKPCWNEYEQSRHKPLAVEGRLEVKVLPATASINIKK